MDKGRIRFAFINRNGSRACKIIREETNIWLYNKRLTYRPDVLVNYGTRGNKLREFYRLFPGARRIPTINREVGITKFEAVNIAKEHGILVPDSKLTLSKNDNVKDFIEKKFKSIGGFGIRPARSKNRVEGKYYQKFIQDRLFEIRVHAFEWCEPSVQKRYGQKETIAWNFSQGGYFIKVNHPGSYKVFTDAIDVSKIILSIFKMGFGAVDFVIDSSYRPYFIEVNSAPGFQTLSKEIYVNAFNKLKTLTTKQLNNLNCLL